LARTGDRHASGELFTQLVRESIEAGASPRLSGPIRNAFHQDEAGRQAWQKLLVEAAGRLIESGRLAEAIVLAWQCHHQSDTALADELFGLVLADPPQHQRLPATLAGVQFFLHTGRALRAEGLLASLTEDDEFAEFSSLWRLRAVLAERQGRLAQGVAHLETAMGLEYQRLAEPVSVQAVRAQYGELIERYERLATAIAPADEPMLTDSAAEGRPARPSTTGDSRLSLRERARFRGAKGDAVTGRDAREFRDLIGGVVRAADRWRSLDTDSTAACQSAARVLSLLGAEELAWDYLTTPLSAKPNESAPWLLLSQTLVQQGDLTLADRAYAAACEAEPTNAQLLWDRAELLGQAGRREAAEELRRQIAEGTWQPRFQALQQRARQSLRLERDSP
jgi:tetratricopeptide (TPR) repeat protein